MRFLSFPTSSGIEPSKLLCDMSKSIDNVWMLNNVLGIGPFKLLVVRLNDDNSVRFPRVSGILPLNAFMPSHKKISLVRFPKVNGIGPLKLF